MRRAAGQPLFSRARPAADVDVFSLPRSGKFDFFLAVRYATDGLAIDDHRPIGCATSPLPEGAENGDASFMAAGN